MKVEKKDIIYTSIIVVLLLAIGAIIGYNAQYKSENFKLKAHSLAAEKLNRDLGDELQSSLERAASYKEIIESAAGHVDNAIGIINEGLFTATTAAGYIDAIIEGLDELEQAIYTPNNNF